MVNPASVTAAGMSKESASLGPAVRMGRARTATCISTAVPRPATHPQLAQVMPSSRRI